MTHQAIIDRTIQVINQLPQERASEISDFADYIIKKYEEELLNDHIKQMVSESEAFGFLHTEEELYSLADLKERYNDQR